MILTFGKWRGHTCEEVLDKDPSYVRWALNVPDAKLVDFIEAQNEWRKLLEKREYKERQDQRETTNLPWWDVLECHPEDSLDSVKKAYRKQMALYHPDKVSQLGIALRELAEKKSKAINVAYETACRVKQTTHHT